MQTRAADCLAGTVLGTAIWYAYYRMTPALLAFLTKGSIGGSASELGSSHRHLKCKFLVPSFIVPICLFLVSVHPEPVDDCPCFEDAIAFVATSAGCCLGQWTASLYKFQILSTLGLAPFSQDTVEGDFAKIGIWLAAAIAKIALGISVIFLWRLLAKRFLYTILPPLFKLFQPIISLPRKGYETAR